MNTLEKKKLKLFDSNKKMEYNLNIKDGRTSPINKCPICLGKIDDKSYANKCFHCFCRTCLYEWSKVKKDCPVCRQPFDKLIVNVKSDDDYEEQNLNIVDEFFYKSCNLYRHLSLINFQYRYNGIKSSTTIPESNLLTNLQSINNDGNIQAGSIAHRRYIYNYDWYVLPYGNGNSERTRQVSSFFYKRNPACIYRLVPFINLELKALILNQNVRNLLCNLILKKLPVVDINSSKFEKILLPYLIGQTSHFIHEFYNFARSCYDFNEYFNIAVYVPKEETQIVKIKKEEDDISLENPTCSSTFNRLFKNKFAPEKTLNEVNNNSSDSEIEMLCEIKLNKNLKKNKQHDNYSDNPKPGPSGLQNTQLNLKLKHIQQNYTEDSDSDFDNYKSKKDQKSNLSFLESDDDDSVEIIEVLKPRHLRTPEVIELTEDEDEDRSINDTENKKNQKQNEENIVKQKKVNSNIQNKNNSLNLINESKVTKLTKIDEKNENNNLLENKSKNFFFLNDFSNDFRKRKYLNENNKNCKIKSLASVIIDPKNEVKEKFNLNQDLNKSSSSFYSSKNYFPLSQSNSSSYSSSFFNSISFKNNSSNDFYIKSISKKNKKNDLKYSKDYNIKVIKQINNEKNNTFNRLPSIIGSQSSTLKKLNQKSFFNLSKTEDELN